MAQTNYTPISLYYSTTASAVPTAANLVQGELAINTADGKLYYEDSSGVVQVLATKSTGSIGGSNTQVQFNNSGSLGGSSGLTWDGSFLTTSSIKNSALTSGRVTYAGASGLLTDSANLLYSGTDLTVYGLTVGRGLAAVATNTAVGVSALAANTSGSLNSAVGYQAGLATTTGAGLAFFGNATGIANTTGSNNVAVGGFETFTSNQTGANNVAVGSGSLKVTTGSGNTAVGYQTGYSNTSGSVTAFGFTALKNNTTGSLNVGIGNAALFSNTTASNNTAVGYQSLYTNTTGASNVALGPTALYANTTGSFSTAIGSNAGAANTTGTISALGYLSLYANTTGTANTAIGGYDGSNNPTMRYNTTGNYNTAVGFAALGSNTTASNNTAVGYQAGYTNTAGQECAYIGGRAGYSTTGGDNTFVGYNSGNAVTTGYANTIIGKYTGNNGGLDIRTANNYIVLSDGSGNPLISTNNTSSVALNGAVPQTGTGITFPATQSASSNANTLDDYEEGTFTATLTTTTGSITLLSSSDLCSYTKIGRQVTVVGLIIVDSVSTPVGSVSLNLPFAIGNESEAALGGGTFVIYQDAPTYATTLQTATFEESTSILSIGLTASAVGAGDQFRFGFTYFA